MLNVQVKLIQTVSIRQDNGSINVYDLDSTTIASRRVETLGEAEQVVSSCLHKHPATSTSRIEATVVLPTDDDRRTFAQARPFADWQSMDDDESGKPVPYLWQVEWDLDHCTVATR